MSVKYIQNSEFNIFRQSYKPVIFISAFFDIGRGSWPILSRSVDKYISSFYNYLPFNYNMILFMDDKYIDKIPLTTNLKIIPINLKWLETNVYAWKVLEKAKEIHASEFYKNLASQHGSVENIYPEYNAINHAKIDFIIHAIMNHIGEDSDAMICWSDFGYFNSILHNNPDEFPNRQIDCRYFSSNKINCFLYDTIKPNDYDVIYTLTKAPVTFTGSFWCGDCSIMFTYQKLYHECLNELYQQTISDDDQHVMLRCFIKDSSIFELFLENKKWPQVLLQFQKNI
jgi:hypothetical protein